MLHVEGGYRPANLAQIERHRGEEYFLFEFQEIADVFGEKPDELFKPRSPMGARCGLARLYLLKGLFQNDQPLADRRMTSHNLCEHVQTLLAHVAPHAPFPDVL
jgi:hypothetical protein